MRYRHPAIHTSHAMLNNTAWARSSLKVGCCLLWYFIDMTEMHRAKARQCHLDMHLQASAGSDIKVLMQVNRNKNHTAQLHAKSGYSHMKVNGNNERRPISLKLGGNRTKAAERKGTAHLDSFLLRLLIFDSLAPLLNDGKHPPVQKITHSSSVCLCLVLHFGIEAQHGSYA
jgi:hypothetical protein